MRISTRKIIQEAWEFTQKNRKTLIWYAFVPSLLGTVVGILYLIYQYFAFRSSRLFENWEYSFTSLLIQEVLKIIRDNFSSTIPFLIVAIIIGILYLLLPSFCEGALIQLIARKRNQQDTRPQDGIGYGFLSFLPLFEYSWLVRTFSIVSMITWSGFIARNLGLEVLQTLLPVLIIFTIVGIILSLFFTYTEFFIVIDNAKVMESITKSCTLVVTHLEKTLLLSILMLIISVRIILQILVVLLIPLIIIGVVYLVASATLSGFALIIGAILGLILLYLAAYLNGVIHIFAATVWTFTFLELTQNEPIHPREKG